MKVKITTDKNFLHAPSREVDITSGPDMMHARSVAIDLRDTLAASKNGVGLAAPQIGQHLRIFIFQKNSQNNVVVINPEFAAKNRSMTILPGGEGCLSCPGASRKITRHKTIIWSGYDENGEQIGGRLTGLAAIIFQHELDHLNGKLITD